MSPLVSLYHGMRNKFEQANVLVLVIVRSLYFSVGVISVVICIAVTLILL